jgi:hypothetical protein
MSDDEDEFDRMYRKAVTSSDPMLIIATNIFNLAKLASPFTQETGMKRKTVMLKKSYLVLFRQRQHAKKT